MKGLFLDDERYPEDVTWVNYAQDIYWVVVRNRQSFQCEMEKQVFDIYSFDHDIQDFVDNRENTGHDCLKDLVEMFLEMGIKNIPTILFHTQNPVGKKNMESYVNSFKDFINEVRL